MEAGSQTWKRSLTDAQALLTRVLGDAEFLKKCDAFSEKLIALYRRGGNLFICGNGGSHCDAMHFAEELTGRFKGDRRPLGALALGDPSHVTCVSNDMGFEQVFERQLRGLARKGDLLVTLSTSGNSKNCLRALNAAREMGVDTVALLGRDGGGMRQVADLALVVPAQDSGRIQEIHIKLIHTSIEVLERALFEADYA